MEHTYTADAGFVSRLSTSMTVFQFTRPARVFLIVAFLVLTIFACLTSMDMGWAGAVTGVVVGVLFVLFVAWLARHMVQRRLRSAGIGPGSTYSSRFDDITMTFVTPTSNTTVQYTAYGEIEFQGEFAYLRPRAASIFTVFPGALFPEAERESIRRRIERTAPLAPHD